MAKFQPRMMPGSEPYTPGEWQKVRSMIRDSAMAEEHYSSDELEEHADKLRKAALAKLRERVASGAPQDAINAAELAAWSVGASPEETEAAMQSGAKDFVGNLGSKS